jgi:hypothetical protein
MFKKEVNALEHSLELLFCPSRWESRFEVSIWTIERRGGDLKILEGPTINWIPYSRWLENTGVLTLAALGQIDACLARGQAVRTPLVGRKSEFAGVEFKPANEMPRALKASVLAA